MMCFTSQHTWESHAVDLTTSGTMVDKRQTEIDQVHKKRLGRQDGLPALVDKPLLPLAHPEGTIG